MKRNYLQYFFITVELISCCLSADIPAITDENNKSNATSPMDFTLDLNPQFIVLKTKISIEAAAVGNIDKLTELFNNKLITAFQGTNGFKYIRISNVSKSNGNFTCVFKAYYNASLRLPELKSSLINIVRPNLQKLSNFNGGTFYHFKLDEKDFNELIRQGVNRSKCSLLEPSCPKEYVCLDVPYFTCRHRCAYEKEKLSCKHGGRCFVDQLANTTKCSCPNTDSYVYTGHLCEEKVEKLKLGSNYIIAISVGGGGAIILILVVVIIVVCRRKQVVVKKQEEIDENYELAPRRFHYVQPNQNRNSKISLDGVSNGLYSGSVDIKFVGGRSHSVYKDDRGQEIYVYRPASEQLISDRPPSINGDIGMSTPNRSSFYEDTYSERRFEIERPQYSRGSFYK